MRPRKGASEVKKRKKLQRSLKDKIAAAQKLVSPNGKVETAPVLRETCNAIKAVKKQIQDLCNTASNVGSLFQSQRGEKKSMYKAKFFAWFQCHLCRK
ncbi:transcription factor bHLH113-like isoform X4 [Capsicum annuum]|uniref:transcription factor bHLH113-like isoform X4 n=1 Tax=Capsicum annuum TaxID=4072 RepID=UPI001FB1056B|nr:transcription factor bHLH113-like isoform X4 [Capsicum annuum]